MADVDTMTVRVGPDPIGSQRAVIDDIDAVIIAWLQARRAVSRSVQEQRVAAGHAVTDLTRERQIIAAYDAALGYHGRAVACQILDYCKGTFTNGSR